MKFRWRMRQKLAAGLILVTGMTALLSIGSFYGLYSYRRSNKIFNYHQQQLEILGYLELAVSSLNFPSRESLENQIDPNVGRRDKLVRITRIDEMLAKYRDGLERSAAYSFSEDGLEKQRAKLSEMERYLTELKTLIRGSTPQVVANAPSRLRDIWWTSGNERDIIAKLIATLGQLRGVIHADVTRHVEADRSNYRGSLAVVWSTTALVLGMLIVLVWLVYRSILTPIRELHRGVTKLADGNFDSRVHLDTGDEMQELGEAFNEMANGLQTIYKDLNRQVEERSRQLIRSERLASVGFLAAGVAHEINNPLASIAFCGEALESRLRVVLPRGGEDVEVVENYLGMIQQEAFRCKTITEKLLDFSRVGEPERVDTDIVALIRNVVEMVHLGRTKGKDLIFEPTEMVIGKVNPQEMKQVLLNLVVNGLESTDEGGTVRIVAKKSGGVVQIKVIDDGCGMTEEVLENLFEPFFTRNRTGKGTGLGLSISHLIVCQHRGTLDAESAGPGKGSTFTITLPTELTARQAA